MAQGQNFPLNTANQQAVFRLQAVKTCPSVPFTEHDDTHPYWAHRTVNTGVVPFVFFAAWAGEAGHDYGTIEQLGFAKLVVQHDGQVVVIDNAKYK
ncbi:MAG: hypothetical protein KJ064_23640 [Anaerolineae bacterium]|nr:hypothetical protein [Anaerolineae bacterium]